MSDSRSWHVPAHVPPELVVDFDLFEISAELKDPVDKWRALVDAGVPKIFWSPRNGGHWTFLSYEDIREGYKNYQSFSNRHTPNPPLDPWPVFQPQSVDPPEHAKFRNLLAPLFTPNAIRAHEAEVRRRARALIDTFADDGHCDFVAQFSARMPSGMFIHLMGMDEARLPEFLALAETFMRVQDPEGKARNVADIYAVLEDYFAQKRNSPPGDDIASRLLGARDADGKPFPHDEIINCAFLLFLAGLDTVTSTMTYIWRYLASDAAARAYIRDNLDVPDKLARAMDELFRINSVSNIYRRVNADIVYKGVAMKEGDKLVLPNNVANRDPAVFERPTTIDLDRKVNTHLTFGLGVHRCLGQHLAKTEVAMSLREWLPRIVDFSIAADADIEIFAGPVMGLRSLPLVWETPARH
jgi:cytochrome P450